MRSSIIRVLVLVLPLAVSAMACESAIDNLPTTPDPVTVTETFTGSININGAATHNVFTGATGVVQATLTSLGENPPSKIGFSMGTLSGSTCSLVLTNDNAVVTSVLTGTVANLNGSLCVRVYDVGALTESVEYTFTVTHQ
jgi:ABC-type nitrate/sulfonate/bicarbonate transport system permease component